MKANIDPRTKWIVPAIVAGAVIIAATVAVTIVATRPAGPEVVETESALTAWTHAQTGWYCEVLSGENYMPVPDELLEIFAQGEPDLGRDFGADTPEPDFRCEQRV